MSVTMTLQRLLSKVIIGFKDHTHHATSTQDLLVVFPDYTFLISLSVGVCIYVCVCGQGNMTPVI